MARYRRYRKYTRRNRRKWSTRMSNFSGSQLVGSSSTFVAYANLASNPAQSEDTVSNLYTVKNIDCSVEIQANYSNILENLQAYVMFIPQGYIPTGTPSAYSAAPFQHPEWIMAHRYYGSPTIEYQQQAQTTALTPGFPPLRLKSRLSRKLDTGDRVVLILLGNNLSTTSSIEVDYRGLVKYNTKAN